MDKRSLSDVINCVTQIRQQLNIPCLLIGGFAVNQYGFSRNTLDIDFMIAGTRLHEVKSLMRERGFTQISQHENVTFFSKPDDSFRVDFLTVDENTVSRLEANAQTCVLQDSTLHLPCLRDLLAMKIFALKGNFERRKDKDLVDVAYLTLLNRLDYHQEILPLCERYGTPAIAERIQAELRRLQS